MSASLIQRPIADFFQGDIIQLPEIDKNTAIGICVAIAGNIIISLAINLQKLAHVPRNLDSNGNRKPSLQTFSRPHPAIERVTELSGEVQNDDSTRDSSNDSSRIWVGKSTLRQGPAGTEHGATPERQPLLSHTPVYGSSSSGLSGITVRTKKFLFSVLSSFQSQSSVESDNRRFLPRTPSPSNARVLSGPSSLSSAVETSNEIAYLKSKLWWTGFLLMNVGEMGNFISYAYAPASIVAPLGTVALVTNCLFAPLLLQERFRKVEILGIIVAIVGAITVVLSANTSDTRLNRDGLIHAISQRPFVLYSAIYLFGAIVLSSLSAGPIGNNWVFVDVGLCALFGGFTVLSTKALSTLITMEWIRIFSDWIIYPTILVLVGTGIGQIKYLNRALMRFDSKVVVPTQFVFFNLSAILGSAILYGEFVQASFHQMITFLYGCAATFAGVYMITWSGQSNVSQDREGGYTDLNTVGHSRTGDHTRLVAGSFSHETRQPSERSSLRRKQSSTSLVGFSPAQRLLIAHSPPRNEFDPRGIREVE